LLFHCNRGYTNAPECYVKRTAPVYISLTGKRFHFTHDVKLILRAVE